MVSQTFLKNRAEFPRTELAKLQGNWVAFSADGTRIVAYGESFEQVATELDQMGAAGRNVVFECLPGAEDGVFLGAGE